MKYWRLYNSAEKEVGFVPQIIEPVFKGNYADGSQLWNIYSRKIDSTTVIPKGQLHKKAKLTDLMSASFLSGQLFISDKLRDILEQSDYKGIQFAKTEIITKMGDHIKSNIIHPYKTDLLFIDFRNTVFQTSNVMGNIIYETKQFDSSTLYHEEWNSIIEHNKGYESIDKHINLSISKLILKEDNEFDICSIFGLTYGGIGYIVSERLKNEIEKQQCTGVIFKEPNERYP